MEHMIDLAALGQDDVDGPVDFEDVELSDAEEDDAILLDEVQIAKTSTSEELEEAEIFQGQEEEEAEDDVFLEANLEEEQLQTHVSWDQEEVYDCQTGEVKAIKRRGIRASTKRQAYLLTFNKVLHSSEHTKIRNQYISRCVHIGGRYALDSTTGYHDREEEIPQDDLIWVDPEATLKPVSITDDRGSGDKYAYVLGDASEKREEIAKHIRPYWTETNDNEPLEFFPVGEPYITRLDYDEVWVINIVERSLLQTKKAKKNTAKKKGVNVDLWQEYRDALVFVDNTSFEDLTRLYKDFNINEETWEVSKKRKSEGEDEEVPVTKPKQKIPRRIQSTLLGSVGSARPSI